MKELEPENECTTCGDKCYLKECTNCWEVERRLEDYLKSPKGFVFVMKATAKEAKRPK